MFYALMTFLFQWMSFLYLKKKKKLKNFELFLHMPLKFEIIWMRIGQVITSQNDVDFSEITCTFKIKVKWTWRPKGSLFNSYYTKV